MPPKASLSAKQRRKVAFAAREHVGVELTGQQATQDAKAKTTTKTKAAVKGKGKAKALPAEDSSELSDVPSDVEPNDPSSELSEVPSDVEDAVPAPKGRKVCGLSVMLML